VQAAHLFCSHTPSVFSKVFETADEADLAAWRVWRELQDGEAYMLCQTFCVCATASIRSLSFQLVCLPASLLLVCSVADS